MTAVTKAQQAYRKWYAANSAKLNKLRKEKYAADPEKRKKIIAHQIEYRKNKPRPLTDGHHFRMIGKKKVEVFRIGATAKMIGREEQAIRKWESIGRIPPPTIKGTHRYYTAGQVVLLRELAELMDQVRYSPNLREFAIVKKSEEIKALWAGAK